MRGLRVGPGGRGGDGSGGDGPGRRDGRVGRGRLDDERFRARYGPWALVAGASEGIGAAFAAALAERGLDVVLVARRPDPLRALAQRLPARTLAVPADLATPAGLAALAEATAEHEVGLVVVNAADAPIGRFLDVDLERHQRALDLNCRAPLVLAHHYLPAMVDRGRGGLILMSSLAGSQGSPGIATYAATKAFDAILAESLWAELRGAGVDVLACVAGPVETPGLSGHAGRTPPGTLSPRDVAEAALRRLGRGPRVVPGALMKVSSGLMGRLLSRRAAIGVIARASRDIA